MTEVGSTEIEALRVQRAYSGRDSERDRRLYSYFNAGNLFITQERERRILTMLAKHGFSALAEQTILEVGCGSGFWIRQFIQWGARPGNMAGVDLLPDRIADARRTCPASVRLECQNAAKLPFPDRSFDLVTQFTMFSSVLDDCIRARVAAEMLRVVKASGAILSYDFFVDNPRNSDVTGIRKAEIRRLFSGCRVECERLTLAPPISRYLAGTAVLICELLAGLRFLNTHYLALVRIER